MNKIKISLIAFMLFQLNIVKSQVQIAVKNMIILNPNIDVVNDCGTIKFNNEGSININFTTRLTKAYNYNGAGTIKVFLQRNSSSQFIELRSVDVFSSSFPNAPSGDVSFETAFAGNFFLNANSVDYSGSKLIIRYVQGAYQTGLNCDFPITKNLPNFTISPQNILIPCNSTSSVQLSYQAFAIPQGSSLTYSWNYGSGWTFNANGTNSVYLSPTSSTVLPSDVTLTPFINGVAQNSLIYRVNRPDFVSNSTITGNTNVCLGSNNIYNINNLEAGNTVTWSSSDSNIASVSTTSTNQVSVNGLVNGNVNLIATITNQCGQTLTKTFTVNIGVPYLNTGVKLGELWVRKQETPIDFAFNPIFGATNYTWTISQDAEFPPVCPIVSPTTAKFIVNSLPINSLSYSNVLPKARIRFGNCVGNYVVRCFISNNCGGTLAYERYVTVGNDGSSPCNNLNKALPEFNIVENPIRNAELNIIKNEVVKNENSNNDYDNSLISKPISGSLNGPCWQDWPKPYTQNLKQINSLKENEFEVLIYDLFGRLVYKNNIETFDNILKFKDLNISKGNYILNFVSQNNFQKQIIIIE